MSRQNPKNPVLTTRPLQQNQDPSSPSRHNANQSTKDHNPENPAPSNQPTTSKSDPPTAPQATDETETTSSSGTSEPDSDPDVPSDSIVKDNQQPTPPHPHNIRKLEKPNEIQNRLTSFFSQLAEQRADPNTPADEVIEEGSSDSGYDDGDEDGGGQYVEMDLALGVLTENPESTSADVKLPVDVDGENDDEDSSDERQRGTEDGSVMNSLLEVGTQSGISTKNSKVKKRKIEELG